MRSTLALVALFLLSAFLLASPGAADIIHVDIAAVGAETGESWADAYTDLQPALADAIAGDEIWVAAGTYYPSVEVAGTGDRFRSFQLKNEVTVYGGFAGGETSPDERDWESNPTIASGDIGVPGDETDNCLHVFHHPPDFGLDASARLDGFVVTGGFANLAGGDSRKGGGMYNEDSEPTIVNCTFRENSASGSSYARGGAMYNHYCSPTIIDCAFTDNYSYSAGGAIYNSGYSAATASPTIRGCTFTGNDAGEGGNGDGGAIYNATNCSPTIVDCVFIDNHALYNGGAIYNYGGGGGGYVASCLFADNGAGLYGGVLYNRAETVLTCVNCVFTRNEVTASNGHGGVVYNTACDPVFTNCVFHDNVSGCVGQGVYNIQFADAVFTNCILDGEWVFYNGGDSDVVVTYCCLEQAGFEALDLHNVYADPLMVDPAGDDYSLQEGSPCIDAGDKLALPLDLGDLDADLDLAEPIPWDILGQDRCQDDTGTVDTGNGDAPIVDIGACEYGTGTAAPHPTPAAGALASSSHPNPFNPSTEILFTLPASMDVSLKIYHLSGRLVRTLIDGMPMADGRHAVAWNGRDDGGKAMPSGVYFYRLHAGDLVETRKMTLLK